MGKRKNRHKIKNLKSMKIIRTEKYEESETTEEEYINFENLSAELKRLRELNEKHQCILEMLRS